MIAAASCIGPVSISAQTTDGSIQPIEIIPLPDDTVLLFEFHILARRTDSFDRGGWIHNVLVYRESGGPATIQGTVDTPLNRRSVTAWGVTTDVSGGNLVVSVRGSVGQTVSWQLSYTFKEVS